MYDVEGLQVLFVFVRENVINLPQPSKRGVIAAVGECVEISDDVIAPDDRVQKVYQIEQCL